MQTETNYGHVLINFGGSLDEQFWMTKSTSLRKREGAFIEDKAVDSSSYPAAIRELGNLWRGTFGGKLFHGHNPLYCDWFNADNIACCALGHYQSTVDTDDNRSIPTYVQSTRILK